MKFVLLTTLLSISVIQPSVPQRADTTTSDTALELKQITQALLDAVGKGDKATWHLYLADDCLYTSEDGRTMTKDELLSELRPLPPGYEGSLRVANAQVHEYANTAVITYDALESLSIYGQQIDTRFHTTDTYVQRDGQWRMIASQVTVLPGDPTPVEIDSAIYEAYVGRYALAPGVVYNVSRAGRKLFMQREDGEKQELLALDEARFFRKGRRGEIIFVTGGGVNASKLIQRRDNNDIVWTRVPE